MKCKKKIYNKYDGRVYYVNCCKCPACKQKKASKRASRIMCNNDRDHVALFFHLTYNNCSMPYIDLYDFELGSGDIEIKREYDCKTKVLRGQKYLIETNDVTLDKFEYDEFLEEYYNLFNVVQGYKVGVLYYKDVQNFFKRLRINIIRNEKFKEIRLGLSGFKYFVCGEYGETFQRPHWHVLLYVPREHVKEPYFGLWKRAVVEAWPFADEWITLKRFEVAKSAAKYVSEYVNCSSVICPFLQTSKVRPVWHYSHGFGMGCKAFDFDEIVRKIDRDVVTYDYKRVTRDAVMDVKNVPYPAYVANRWFPKFKGFCHLSYDDMYRIVRHPSVVFEYKNRLNLSSVDCHKIIVMLNNRKNLVKSVSSLDVDYPFYYVKFHRLRDRYLMSNFYKEYLLLNDNKQKLQMYDNVKITPFWKPYRKSLLGSLHLKEDDVKFPCDFDIEVHDDNYYTDLFYKRIKQRKFNNVLFKNDLLCQKS